jgi:hypothetical protein
LFAELKADLVETVAFSSRNFDLNGEARTARAKQNSPIIQPAYAISSRHQLG